MRRFTIWFSGLNLYFKFAPFLLLYLALSIAFAKNVFVGDEGRYLGFANNLLKGFYSPPYPDINLWNGPGYPVLIAPFLLLKLPLIILRLLNGFLLYFSLIISYKTISVYSSEKVAFLFTVLLGLYFPIYVELFMILTECFTWFLISLVCFLFVKNFKQENISWKLVVLTAFSIAYLAMTKVIFGYVILLMVIVSLVFFILPQFRISAKKSVFIFLISFLFCFPWLIYTHSLTNKVFYWTDSGGMSLYTMSTPFDGETGQWYDLDQLRLNPNHTVFIDSISKLNPLERDIAFKNAAIKNIKNRPGKYLVNIVSNIGRLLFFPSDYAPNTIFSYYPFIPNMFMFVFILIAVSISILYFRRIPHGIIFLLLFITVYLLGCTFVSAFRRMFYVTMPFWFFFLSYVFTRIISIRINKDQII